MSQYLKGLSGYLPLLNGIRLDYCFECAIKSLLPICDEVIVGDAGSTDGTLELLREWQLTEPKIRVVHVTLPRLPTPDEVERDDPNRPPGNPLMLIDWLNQIRAHCRYKMQITLDADEVLEECSYPEVKLIMADETPRWIRRMNLWKSPQWEAPHGTVCGENVVRIGPTRMRMHSDEPCPEGEPEIRRLAVNWDNGWIIHLGFLRRPEAFLKKSRVVQALIHNTYDPRLREAEQTGKSWVELSPFPENRPLIPCNKRFAPYVQDWLLERGYEVNK